MIPHLLLLVSEEWRCVGVIICLKNEGLSQQVNQSKSWMIHFCDVAGALVSRAADLLYD